MHRVLITGITGFLGSHIAKELVDNGVEVIGLIRPSSDIWRCEEFKEKVHWVQTDGTESFNEALQSLSFDIIIHSGWIGVESDERNSWTEQTNNITFLANLLEAGKKANVKKMIFLGSQAEYGNVDGKISEEEETNADNAYGAVKLASLEIVKSFCNTNNINWIWLRLFSVFGEKQGENWLVPSLINAMHERNEMDMTLGEQKYAYLYIKDFRKIVSDVVLKSLNSGVYNVSSDNPQSIKSLVLQIKNKVNPNFKLNFGAIEYRQNQSMHIEGDMKKLFAQIGKTTFTDHIEALENTINYYMKKS